MATLHIYFHTYIHTYIRTYIFSLSQQPKGLGHVIVEASKSHTIRDTQTHTQPVGLL